MLIVACLCAYLSGWAQNYDVVEPSVGGTFKVGKIYYTVTSTEPRTVSVCRNADNYWIPYSGVINIPKSVTLDMGIKSWTYAVTGIAADAFDNRDTIENITIPSSIIEIEKYAFGYGFSTGQLTIEDGDDDLVMHNYSFYVASVRSKKTYIGRNITLPESPGTNCSAFANSALNNVTLGPKVKKIGTCVFEGAGITSIILPAGLESIGTRAFKNNWLTSISIPASVINMESDIFRDCRYLTKVIFEDGNKSLELGQWTTSGFDGYGYACTIDSLYLGRSLIGSNPFGHASINHLIIGRDVNSFPVNDEFFGISDLQSIAVSWESEEDVINMGMNSTVLFSDDTYNNATLYVPGGTVPIYQNTEGWKKFKTILPKTYQVTITASSGGVVTMNDTVAVSDATDSRWVKREADVSFTIMEEDGYDLKSVTMNGENITQQALDGLFTIESLTTDVVLEVEFAALPRYSVTATASNGGTITPASATVISGRNTTVTMSANEGYELKSVTVNNVDKTSEVVDGVLTLSNVQENKTVVATFQKLRYTIAAAECEHGSISLSANEVEWDASATATFTPAAHYEVATVSVNGDDRTAQLSNNKLTIANIRQAITVGATFRLQNFAVTETHNAGGNVSLSAGMAQWGSTVTVTITPDDEHLVKRVTVNSVDVTGDVADNEYTVTVEGATAITVTFESKPYFSVTATSTAGGTATVGNGSVMWGRSTTVTLTPDECHELKNITVNGEDRTDEVVDDVLTLSDIRENTAVVATFGIITETITMATSSGAPREMKGYSSDRGLDFTHVADVKAYIASFFTKEHTTYLTRIYVVPPHTGIVLKTDNPGVTVDVPTTNEDVYIANLLMPAVENVTVKPTETIDGVDYRNLMVGMLNGTSTMGFVEFSSQVVRSNNCYLRVPVSFYNSAASARSVGGLNMVFDDEVEATGIQAIEEYQNEETGNTYDLGGRKVNNSRKGLVIKNGKLIYVKP